jgi:hypothetical protein
VATFTQLASGNWRVQVRRKTRFVAETFRRQIRRGNDFAALLSLGSNHKAKLAASYCKEKSNPQSELFADS